MGIGGGAGGFGLPAALQSSGFLDDEYTQIILPARICDANAYFRVRRPGRGVALDRGKRAKVWEIVEQMRRDQRVANYLSYGEIAAISAHWLETRGTTLADHVLVDEGKTSNPSSGSSCALLSPKGPTISSSVKTLTSESMGARPCSSGSTSRSRGGHADSR